MYVVCNGKCPVRAFTDYCEASAFAETRGLITIIEVEGHPSAAQLRKEGTPYYPHSARRHIELYVYDGQLYEVYHGVSYLCDTEVTRR